MNDTWILSIMPALLAHGTLSLPTFRILQIHIHPENCSLLELFKLSFWVHALCSVLRPLVKIVFRFWDTLQIFFDHLNLKFRWVQRCNRRQVASIQSYMLHATFSIISSTSNTSTGIRLYGLLQLWLQNHFHWTGLSCFYPEMSPHWRHLWKTVDSDTTFSVCCSPSRVKTFKLNYLVSSPQKHTPAHVTESWITMDYNMFMVYLWTNRLWRKTWP